MRLHPTRALLSAALVASATASCRSSEAVSFSAPATAQPTHEAAGESPDAEQTSAARNDVSLGAFDAAVEGAAGDAGSDAQPVASASTLDGGPDRRWTRAKTPAVGAAASIGDYANGCLRGGVELPASTDYVVMHPSRRRFFGHPALVAFLGRLGEGARHASLAPIYIGDLAQPRGGPTLTGHASHQTGLDVDVSFIPPKPKSQGPVTAAERESLSARAIVDLATNRLTPAFDKSALRLVEIAAKDPAVERIFVNAAVKQKLCETAKGQSWIGRVRPWWAHHDHFHVRLRCPAGDTACVAQAPLPANDGCDASLAWWFSAEAKAGPKSKPGAPPKVPIACEGVIAP